MRGTRAVTAFLFAAVLATGASVATSIVAPAEADARRCTPGYSPCIRNRPSDVDCHGGGGNGPRYTRPGVEYRVTGSDRYGLDSNNNGWGCGPHG